MGGWGGGGGGDSWPQVGQGRVVTENPRLATGWECKPGHEH